LNFGSIFGYTTRSPAIAEKAAPAALSGIAVQHAYNGYSRGGNFGGSLVHNFTVCFECIHQWFKKWGV